MPLSWRPIWARVRAKVHQSPTLLFGVPFVSSIVVGSFFLAQLTQTRYEQHDAKVRALTQEEKLRLQRDRKPLDIREEYFKLQSRADELDDWEPKRVARPVGMPEWGGVPAPAPEGREAVREDLDAHWRSSFFARRKPIEAEERPASERETAPPPPKATRKPPVVLGPDGKPCRACSSKLAFGAALRNVTKRSPCPPDVEELGHSTWTFLHSAAAYYPDAPTSVQRHSMRALLDALPHVYPCSVCAEDLRRVYATSLANEAQRERAVQDGPSLRTWLCELHNSVNERLGKPIWDCSDAARLAHRWFEPPDDSDC